MAIQFHRLVLVEGFPAHCAGVFLCPLFGASPLKVKHTCGKAASQVNELSIIESLSFEILEERRLSSENDQLAFDCFTLGSAARIPIGRTILHDSCYRNEGHHAGRDSRRNLGLTNDPECWNTAELPHAPYPFPHRDRVWRNGTEPGCGSTPSDGFGRIFHINY